MASNIDDTDKGDQRSTEPADRNRQRKSLPPRFLSAEDPRPELPRRPSSPHGKAKADLKAIWEAKGQPPKSQRQVTDLEWRRGQSANEAVADPVQPVKSSHDQSQEVVDMRVVTPGSLVFLNSDDRLKLYLPPGAEWHHALILGLYTGYKDLAVATLTTFGRAGEAPTKLGRRIGPNKDADVAGDPTAEVFSPEHHLAISPAPPLKNGLVLTYAQQERPGVHRDVVFLSLREVYLVPQQALWFKWPRLGGPDDRLSKDSMEELFKFMAGKTARFVSPWSQESTRVLFKGAALVFDRPPILPFLQPRIKPPSSAAIMLRPQTPLFNRRSAPRLSNGQNDGADDQEVAQGGPVRRPQMLQPLQSCMDALIKRFGVEPWPLPANLTEQSDSEESTVALSSDLRELKPFMPNDGNV